MADPFSALLRSLDPVFHFEPVRNEKYIFATIQQLKEATEGYNSKAQITFINLLKALRASLPYIEKWRVDFNSIQNTMDELAKNHSLPSIDWSKGLNNPNAPQKFQFNALNHSGQMALIPWITSKTEKPFNPLNPFEITQAMIDLKNHHGFSQKLSNHLKENPDFLERLIVESERNFIKISKTRLSLYLTDKQISIAIMKHMPKLVRDHANPFMQVELLIDKLNTILSQGRSVTTLLRNTEAKAILDGSIFIQVYQSDEFKTRHTHHPHNTPHI